MNLLEVATAANNFINGATEFNWKCFGENCVYLSFGDSETHLGSCVFDTDTETVHAIELYLKEDGVAYRWIDPDKEAAFIEDCTANDIDPYEAWEGVRYTKASQTDSLAILSRLANSNLGS